MACLLRIAALFLLISLLMGCSQGEKEVGEKGAKEFSTPKIGSKDYSLQKPEGYYEIVDKVHGIKFYLPEGWIYRVDEGVASFYEPSYSKGIIIIPLSDATKGVEEILKHFNKKTAYVKGDKKSISVSFEADLSSVVSLTMPGRAGELIELRSPKEVRVVLSAFKDKKAGVAYVFFFDGSKIPEELKTIAKSLRFIKEREELSEVDVGNFATAKLPKGYTAEGRSVQSRSCPGYYSGIYGKIKGERGGSYEIIYAEYSYAFYTSLDLGYPWLEEYFKQQRGCLYEYIDLESFQTVVGKGNIDMCYKSIEEYTESLISLFKEKYPDIHVKSLDIVFKNVNVPENLNSKLYILTSDTNPMFIAYVVVQGLEMESSMPTPYGSLGMKMIGGNVLINTIDAKSPEEFSVFMNVKDTIKLKDEWLERNMKAARECYEYYMREARREIQHSREITNMITETMREISAMHWDSWEKEREFQERMAESVTRILSDYTALRDPETNEIYEVESFAQRYWINDEGHILGTDWDVSESDLLAEGWRPLEENPAGFVRDMWG